MTDWEKRARELLPNTCPPHGCDGTCKPHTTESARAAAIQLAAEMADERTREIARRLEDGHDLPVSASIARSFISKPKMREDVLEEALRECSKMCSCAYGTGSVHQHHERCALSIARRALEWKAGDK